MKTNNSTNIIPTIAVVLVSISAVLAGMSSLAMPAVVPVSAPAGEFSAERAMEQIALLPRRLTPLDRWKTHRPVTISSPSLED